LRSLISDLGVHPYNSSQMQPSHSKVKWASICFLFAFCGFFAQRQYGLFLFQTQAAHGKALQEAQAAIVSGAEQARMQAETTQAAHDKALQELQAAHERTLQELQASPTANSSHTASSASQTASSVSLTASPQKYLFLDLGWEQFNAGRVTFHDYSMIASLAGRTPVIPFVGLGYNTYVGHPNHPAGRSHTDDGSLEALTDIIHIDEPVAYARYEHAMDACGPRIGIVHILHSNNAGSNNAACHPGLENSNEYKTLTETEALWGASMSFRQCMSTHAIDIDSISDSPAQCLVLQNFHGLHGNHRGKLMVNLSEVASTRMSRYKHVHTIVADYRAPWSDAWSARTHNLIPDTLPLVKASVCAWSSSNNTATDYRGRFNALQFRLEGIWMHVDRVASGISAAGKMHFFEKMINRTVVEVLATMNNTVVGGNFTHLPLYVISDIGSVDPEGHRHGGSMTIGGQPVPRYIDQRLSQLLGVLGEVHISSDCDPKCFGPTCFFKDAALFMLAEIGVTIWSGGGSQGQMKRVRDFAEKQTLLIHPDYANLTTAPPI
jgi:hypothetical protein